MPNACVLCCWAISSKDMSLYIFLSTESASTDPLAKMAVLLFGLVAEISTWVGELGPFVFSMGKNINPGL